MIIKKRKNFPKTVNKFNIPHDKIIDMLNDKDVMIQEGKVSKNQSIVISVVYPNGSKYYLDILDPNESLSIQFNEIYLRTDEEHYRLIKIGESINSRIGVLAAGHAKDFININFLSTISLTSSPAAENKCIYNIDSEGGLQIASIDVQEIHDVRGEGVTISGSATEQAEYNFETSGGVEVSSRYLYHEAAGGSTASGFSNWVQKGSDIDGETNLDYSGGSVSISEDGNTVAIGAPYNDANGADSGHVRIYSWNNSNWVQKGSDIDGEAAGDYSGYSVSLSSDGNTVAIGAPDNDGSGAESGHVRIYSWNNSSWVQKGFDIDGEASLDYSGFIVSLSDDGDTVAIGAIYNDGSGSDSGHVRIYSWNNSSWVQKGSDIDGEATGDQSGYSVSISSDGDTVAIGAPTNDDNGADSGHVRIYSWNNSNWVQKGSDIDGEVAGDYSGYSVSLSDDGDTVAIGAVYNDGSGTDSGHVRIYGWNNSNWVQKGSDIDGESAGDYSGYNVSLSDDGNTVAIGAIYNDANSTDSGHTRIYGWNGSSWSQKGGDIGGEAAGDQSGYSVSLSSDGNSVAIGAVYNDANGTDSGHVRIYRLVTTTEQLEYNISITGGSTSGGVVGESYEQNEFASGGLVISGGAHNNIIINFVSQSGVFLSGSSLENVISVGGS